MESIFELGSENSFFHSPRRRTSTPSGEALALGRDHPKRTNANGPNSNCGLEKQSSAFKLAPTKAPLRLDRTSAPPGKFFSESELHILSADLISKIIDCLPQEIGAFIW
ncbi:unnamed protein product, partial [Nesidiocoris tenuis]